MGLYTRDMQDGLGIMLPIAECSHLVAVLNKLFHDLTSPMERGISAFVSSMAEDEKGRIVRRAKENGE